MKLIVGLGNPGKKYLNTRHNVGFDAVNAITSHLGVTLNKEKFNGHFYKGDDFIIAKPQTFMNLSGDFVQAITKFFKIDTKDILVIYDDMDYPVGDAVMKPTGSAGGQNGMKDIIAKLGVKDIARIKIGIGRSDGAVDHVLGNFSKEDRANITSLMPKVIKAAKDFVHEGVAKAMNDINTK